MKKILVVLVLFLIMISGANQQQQFTLLDYFDGSYTVYTKNSVNENSINLGFCYMNNFQVETQDIEGESIKVENFEPSQAIRVLNAKVVETEYLDNGMVVIYAYTPLIQKRVKLGHKNVNLQIAHSDDFTIVGWPLILGGF